MKFKTTTFENGLRLVTAEIPEAFSVSISIFAGVGSRHEDFNTNGGVSHFLEHLLFKGSKKRPNPRIIAEAIDGVGGSGNAYTSKELTSYYIKLPKQHANLGIDILSDMIKNPLLNTEEVDRERNVILEEMNVDRDDPAGYVYDLLPPLLWPKDQLGQEITGSEEVIKTIPRDQIAQYQQLNYSPDNLVVAVAGSTTHEQMEKQVKELMGDMAKQPVPKRSKINTTLSDQLVGSLVKETNQAHIMIGCQAYPYNHPLDAAARVVTNILGAGMSSRLWMRVREQQGLAYTVYAYYGNFIDTGIFSAYAGVNLDKIPQAISSIMTELERLRNEPVEAAELEKVKNKMSGGLQLALENTGTVADRIGSRLLLLNQIKPPEETLAEIAAVTIKDVQKAADELLEPARLRMSIIAPKVEEAQATFEKLSRK